MHRNIQARRVMKVMLVDKTWYYAWAPGLLHRTSIFPWFFMPLDQNRTWGFSNIWYGWLIVLEELFSWLQSTVVSIVSSFFLILFINQMGNLCWIGSSKPWWTIWFVESVNWQRYPCPSCFPWSLVQNHWHFYHNWGTQLLNSWWDWTWRWD